MKKDMIKAIILIIGAKFKKGLAKMINKITIDNFKSINHIELELDRINILIGGNNSGKTSILQAIQFGCSIMQTINITSNIPWRKPKDFTRSIEPTELVYSPLKDVSALAHGGELKQGDKYTIKISYKDTNNDEYSTSIKRGKNRNIAATINKSELAKKFVSIENPMCIFVPGLAGIPYNEEFKSESIVRKAAAKGDANAVLRNILWLLKQNTTEWNTFIEELSAIFPNISLDVNFNQQIDEYIDVKINERTQLVDTNGNSTIICNTLPIDAVGTGVLQAIQILSYINVYHPQLLILDEPDAHLHPNNQRKILKMLFSLAETKDFQLLISTHSRHLIDIAEDNAKISWIKNGSIQSEDLSFLKILLDLGALDRGDLLKNGLIKCVFLTEDSTDRKMLESVLESSGFNLYETDIWSYNGCTKVDTALVLAEFIKKHSPATKIIIHRDRDYMTSEEIEVYKSRICVNNNLCFITIGSDIESYYISEKHIQFIFPSISLEDATNMIERATKSAEEKSIEKYINSRDNVERMLCRNKGKLTYNVGKLSITCRNNYSSNPTYYRHGKTVLKALKQIIQNEIKGKTNLIVTSPFISDHTLSEIAEQIWTP